MTFVNGALAFGAIALSIPLIIHLFNRSRFQVVHWGAMRLLEPVVRTNRRRIRIEQLILLLVRMAIPALLALCMAGPVITGWRPLAGNAKSSLVLLLDNSYSMDAGGETGSAFRRAANSAAEIIRRQPRGSDVSVVLMSGGRVGDLTFPTNDRDAVAEAVAELSGGCGPAAPDVAVESAAEALTSMQHAKRDVVVISDFQQHDWLDGDRSTARERALDLVRSSPLEPTVTLFRVGREVGDNLSIQSLDVTPDVVGIDRPVTIRASIHNHSERPFPNVRLFLQIDGRTAEADDIELGAGQDAQIVFTHTFQTAGSHTVEVHFEGDSLPSDNRRQLALRVWDRIPVLIVNGDPGNRPLEGETDFLEIALSPFAAAQTAAGSGGSVPLADLVETKTVAAHAFTGQTLKRQRVVVLANVAKLDAKQVDTLHAFVRAGNSLIIFAGDRIDTEWYNAHAYRDGRGFLPAQFAKLQTPVDTRLAAMRQNNAKERTGLELTALDAGPEAGHRIAAQHFDHPALQLFNDPRNGNLADGRIHTWFQLLSTNGAPDDSRRKVGTLARFENGDPFLVEKSLGRGLVIQCSTACDDAWSNLPVRPFYLPFMQRLTTWLASRSEPPVTLETGETLVTSFNSQDAAVEATVVTPGGDSVSLPVRRVDDADLVSWANTAQPGIYTVNSQRSEPVHFAVNSPPAESVLDRLDSQQIDELAAGMDASVVGSTHEYFELDSNRRYGRAVWRHLFWLLLVFVVGEMLLQQFFTRRRRSADASMPLSPKLRDRRDETRPDWRNTLRARFDRMANRLRPAVTRWLPWPIRKRS